MIQKKPITEEQALKKMGNFCAKTEHCSSEIMDKMYKMGLSEEAKVRILGKLFDYGYINDERYTKAFISDKIKYNKWGRRKIEQALWAKHIDSKIYTPALDAIPDEEYLTVLRPLLKNKYPSINANNDYERSVKLIKYGLSKGFSFDLIKQCVDTVIDEEEL